MSPTPYSIRPSDSPPPAGSRAVLAHLLAGALNSPGSLTAPTDWREVRRPSREDRRRAQAAYARAAYTVAGSDVLHPSGREGVEGRWVPGWRFDVDYHPDRSLMAVEALFVAAGYDRPYTYPKKTTLECLTSHGAIMVKWGYGGEPILYYPLADGRVLVVSNGVMLSGALAGALADGTYPDIEVLTTPDGSGVFRWTDYLRDVIDLLGAAQSVKA